MYTDRQTAIEAAAILEQRLGKLLGYTSLTWHPFLSDFILVGQKLEEEQPDYGLQAAECIAMLQLLGVDVLITGDLAIIDRRILYEGSLNILSQGDSCEMRRTYSEQLANQMIDFISISKFIG